MWGLFSRLRPRGDDMAPYIRRLNDTAHAMDPSRPTVALSDQDGEINFVTDLIVWKQTVGWNRGTTDDVAVWRDQLRRSWSHLRSGVSYGGSGFIGHKSYTAQSEPRANWMPEDRQTRFHEEYARNLQSDSLFWGMWIDNMFDYGSYRRPTGERRRAGNLRPPRLQGCLLPLPGHVEPPESDAPHRGQAPPPARCTPPGFPHLFVGRRAAAPRGGRHGGRDRVCRLPVPLGFGRCHGTCRGEGCGGRPARQRHYSCRQRAKPKRLQVPRRTAGPQTTN